MGVSIEQAHTDPDGVDRLSDVRRRELLVNTATTLGAAGLVAASVPFIASLEPSAAARAAGGPVEAEVGSLAPGQLHIVAWRGKPVWLMRRTEAMVRALENSTAPLADPMSRRSVQPASCVNATRSERPDLFVAVGICTHLGCSPQLDLEAPIRAELHAPGGFLCPCHGSRFDLAGRVVKNVPAPTNLEIPDYRFTSATRLRIG